jgi:hypothetical protein
VALTRAALGWPIPVSTNTLTLSAVGVPSALLARGRGRVEWFAAFPVRRRALPLLEASMQSLAARRWAPVMPLNLDTRRHLASLYAPRLVELIPNGSTMRHQSILGHDLGHTYRDRARAGRMRLDASKSGPDRRRPASATATNDVR